MAVAGNGEIRTFVKVWIAAISSLCYCYFLSKRIPTGIFRLLSLLPVISLFIFLPANLSTFHLSGPTIFYLVWLGNFKLLLFAAGQGPLSSSPNSLLHFIAIALLPIKLKPHLSQEDQQKSPNPSRRTGGRFRRSALVAVKVLLLAAIIRVYDHRHHLHPSIILSLYCCHMYLALELILAVTAFPVRAMLGAEIQLQFNEPYRTTSLQDFWSRRWNLMVTSILRPTTYDPIRRVLVRFMRPEWARATATVATFLVSGLMHEIIYYYFTHVSPTWEVTWFFVLHGVCVVAEVAAKKVLTGKFQLHPAVSGPLTVAFVAVTSNWLFFPQIVRNGVDQKVISEYSILVDFVKDKLYFGT